MRWITILFLLVTLGANAQDHKVLFVGNSYTYFWNLPQVVAALGESQNINIWTKQSTAGGVNLGQHWKNERGLQTHDMIKSEKWDYVVLQDHSMRTISDPDSLDHYMELWIGEINAAGSKPMAYMTWSRSYDPTMLSSIAPGYEAVAVEHDIPVVPVGLIWQKALTLRPDMELYDPDGSHPSTLGTYLTACAFYSAITHQPAKGLPTRLSTKDQHGERIFLMTVSEQDAQYCQSVVDEVLRSYGLD